MVINQNLKLHGKLIGYSILEGDTEIVKHIYHEPVDNMVLNSGKDALLYMDGLGDYSSINTSLQLNARATFAQVTDKSGMLSRSYRGSSNTPSVASMTNMVSQIGTFTTDILSGHPNTGTRYNREEGKIIIRITHDHAQETENQNINEVGWGGTRGSITTNVLFSRVVLPNTVTVQVGQRLRTIYELEVTLSPFTQTSFNFTLTGLGTVTGVQWLQGVFPETSTTFGQLPNTFIDVISTSGSKIDTVPGAFGYGNQRTFNIISSSQNSDTLVLYETQQPLLPILNTTTSNNQLYIDGSGTRYVHTTDSTAQLPNGNRSRTIGTYVLGTFYRDLITFIMEPNWPFGGNITFQAAKIMGMIFNFDSPITKTNTQRLSLTYRISVS